MLRSLSRLFAALLGGAVILACARAAVTPATPPPPAPPALSLEDCIARALKKNFDLKIESFSTDIARESLNAADTAFEPTFTASFQRLVSQEPPALGGINSDTSNTQLGVSELIPTGATLSLTTSVDRSAGPYVANVYTAAAFNPVYGSDVALTVSQPLLRGAGPAVTRAAIERGRLGVTIARLNFKSRVLQVVHDTETAYYNLVFAREDLGVKRDSLALAQQLLDENRTRKITGVATDLDVLSAEVGVANARNGVIVAGQTVHDSEDALLALIGQFEFDSELGAVALEPYQEPSPSFDLSYKLARDNQPDYLAAQAAVQQFRIDTTTAKNSALPSLSVGGSVGYSGSDRTYGSAIGDISNGEAHTWELDLTLSVPWGLRADRARYRSAVASLRQEQARVQQLDQNLLVQVRAAVRAVDTNRQSVDITAKATELAVHQYDLELARFKAGLSTSRQVLETQDDLELARVNELQARVNLRIAFANLHQLESSSLARYHIDLAD